MQSIQSRPRQTRELISAEIDAVGGAMTDNARNLILPSMQAQAPIPLPERDLARVSAGRSEGGCIIGDVKITTPSQQQK